MALLYGVIRTGFSEEFFFRGLLTGSLARRMPLWSANLLQSLIFQLPHLVILKIMPDMWGLLPLIFVGGLIFGWLRIRSGSIVGPWLLHAAINATVCLSIAIQTTP